MDSQTSNAIATALDALERQKAALESQLTRVRTAIEAIQPLLAGEADDQGNGDSLFGPSKPLSNSSLDRKVEASGFRSTVIARMTESVERALKNSDRPLAVAELLDVVRADGVELEDQRQLTDMLYRKSKHGGPFRRVANGLYEIGGRRPAPLATIIE